MTSKLRASCLLLVALTALGAAACSHVVKEKTAPCKRPATLTSFAPVSPRDCGPAAPVNGNPDLVRSAAAAIEG